MKKLVPITSMMALALILITQPLNAQDDKSKRPSPPAQVTSMVGDLKVTIDYSQPSLKGRELNTLAPVGKVWRTGANEASWIELSGDAKVNGQALKKGKYGLFTINNKTEWTIIFNSEWKQWGAYKYDQSKDLLRINVKPEENEEFVEKFTISISEKGEVQLLWGNTIVPFKVEFDPS